ncbi:MAG: amphi-Trp domain-containing protein [Candidatus Hodarchaeales archaeon]|jgi:amphi-Trp domain-containing protein
MTEELRENAEEVEEERVLIESEAKKTASEVSSFLRKLSERIEQHLVTLKQGEKIVTLTIPNDLTLEVEVEEERKGTKTKRSLEIEIEWDEGDINEDALELE